MAIGERIKQARLAAGMSLRALAPKVGVSAQAISKYERGIDKPSSRVLIHLSRELGVKIEYFFRPKHAVVAGLAYRKHPSLSEKAKLAVQAQAQEWLDRFLEVESFFINDYRAFVLPTNLNTDPATMEEVEQAAIDLRKEWGVGLSPVENMVELFEAKGIKVGLIEGISGFDACTFLLDNGTPIIAVKRNLPGDRQRFSLAHELGHIVLNPSANLNSEKAFDRFVGAFLVPEPTVKYELGIKRKELNLYELHVLKHRYGLSMQGWIHRAEDLGIISESVARQMRKIFSIHDWKTSEPGDQLAPESPWRMDMLVLRALGEGIISESRAAELLGKPLGDFWSEVKEKHKGLPVSASI